MRLSSIVSFLAVGSTLACGGFEPTGPKRATTPGADPGASAPAAPTDAQRQTPASACAGIAPPTTITTDAEASDLRLTDGAVFYRTPTKVVRASKDGAGRATVLESADLVRAFVADGGGMVVTIEDPDPPNAVVRIVSLDPDQPATTVQTNWNAAGSSVFAADDSSWYVLADVPNQGEVVYQLPKATPQAMTQLAQADDVVTDPQLVDGRVWYVRDHNRVFEVDVPDAAAAAADPTKAVAPAAPKEMFGIGYAACALAVGSDAAFCSAGATIEQRDLSGGSPKTILDEAKSKVSSPFGYAVWSDGTLYVRSDAADPKMGYTIRAVKATSAGVEERVVACGRSAIGEIAVDKDSVVWTEPGKGAFAAPR